MQSTPHQIAAPRRSGYQNAMLTAIAVLLALGVIDRHAGSGDRVDRLTAPRAALAQPQTDGGLANKLDQNKQIISQLQMLNGKLDRIEAKLSSGISVKVTDMPPLKLPADAKARAADAKPDGKAEPKVEVKPGKCGRGTGRGESAMVHAGIRSRGYTLIEILIVVVMLGIASALVIPSLGSTDALRVQSTVRAIVADINFAQSDALARQQGRAMIFNTDTNSYSIVEVHDTTLHPDTDTVYSVSLNNERKFHSSKLTAASFDGTNTLVFDELGGPVTGPGSSTPGNGGSITVSGSGESFVINVEAYTGRVSVQRQ